MYISDDMVIIAGNIQWCVMLDGMVRRTVTCIFSKSTDESSLLWWCWWCEFKCRQPDNDSHLSFRLFSPQRPIFDRFRHTGARSPSHNRISPFARVILEVGDIRRQKRLSFVSRNVRFDLRFSLSSTVDMDSSTWVGVHPTCIVLYFWSILHSINFPTLCLE